MSIFKSKKSLKENVITYAMAQPMNHAFVSVCVPKKNTLAALLHSGVLPKVL